MTRFSGSKPRVLLLIDVYGWAFHALARGISSALADSFDFTIAAVISDSPVDCSAFDLIHVFGIRGSHFGQKNTNQCKIMKSLFNTIFKDPSESAKDFVERYASEAHAMTVPTLSMLNDMHGAQIPVHLTPEGVDVAVFKSTRTSVEGRLKVGWAGNPSKAYKRFSIAYEACSNGVDFLVADGTLDEAAMIRFYEETDVILCTAEYGEGCPRPLLEGMACGCYGVSFPVGVAPELIASSQDGIVVQEESIEAVCAAIQRCKNMTDNIRAGRASRADRIGGLRQWKTVAPATANAYTSLLR